MSDDQSKFTKAERDELDAMLNANRFNEDNPPDHPVVAIENDDDECVDLVVDQKGRLGYPIEYDRMDEPEKLLGWIHHLCSKGWITSEHIRQLIKVAEKHGVSIDYHA